MTEIYNGNRQLDDAKPRLSEDDIARALLGPRGVPGKPDTAKMVPQQAFQFISTRDTLGGANLLRPYEGLSRDKARWREYRRAISQCYLGLPRNVRKIGDIEMVAVCLHDITDVKRLPIVDAVSDLHAVPRAGRFKVCE
jgi:hypothetical protein